MIHRKLFREAFSLFFLFVTIPLWAQKEISGTITDCERNPLPGVSIRLNDKSVTFSDSLGRYILTVPDANTVITYRYIGKQTEKIKVGNREIIDVSLKQEDLRLIKMNKIESEKSGVMIMNEPKQVKNIMVRKPVIYLYPETERMVSVKIKYDGALSFTYPLYENGWQVTATPGGLLKNTSDGREYAYLFWEGEKHYRAEEVTYDSGFVVHKDSIVPFLQENLSFMGLTPREYNDFIVYWTPYLMQQEWHFIHFRVGEEYDVISENIVSPAPDTAIRVFMDCKGLETPFEVNPQQLQAPARKGFTLVEWGGAELTQPIRVKGVDGEYLNK